VKRAIPCIPVEDYMEPYITLNSKDLSPEALRDLLAPEVAQVTHIHLEIRRFRLPETAVLIAIVGSIGTGLGALITGVLKVAAQKGASTVVLQGRSGRKVEVPANTPLDKIGEYVQLAKQLDVERIEL
jgi:hypothetical protein